MGKKLYPTDTLEQARDILVAWEYIDPALKIGQLTPESLSRTSKGSVPCRRGSCKCKPS